MFCSKCGNELKENSIYCDKCGNKLNEEKINKEENELVTSIFSFVFYVLTMIFSALKVDVLTGVFFTISMALMIASFIQKGKCVFANIVFWLFQITLILGFLSIILSAIIL